MTDADGNQIGIVLPNGDVVDEDGNIVGKMGADGTVSTIQTIGKRGSTARLAIDKDGNVIGYVDDKGNVFGQMASGTFWRRIAAFQRLSSVAAGDEIHCCR